PQRPQDDKDRRMATDRAGPLRAWQRWRWRGRAGEGTGAESGVRSAAGSAFLIRIANAGLAYVSQILMARWMGAFEYGVYVYVWTWVLLVGTVADLGFAVTAQRFIPRYRQEGDLDRVR